MDFIQRNLINERNNLQVELAKAKILIAQLNEARKTEKVIVHGAERDEGEYMPNLQGSLASGKGAKRGRQVDVEPGRAIPGVPKQTQIHHAIELAGGDSDKNNIYGTGKPMKVRKSEILPTNEEAEYISGLENVIVALAESMNMSVEDLLNEVRAVNDNELTTNSGIMKNARNINRVRGVMDRIHNRTQSAGHNAVGTAKDAYDSERGSHMLNALGVKAEVRSSGVGVKVPSQRSPTEAFTAGTHVKMGSNNQSDRAVGALRANNMSSNRANRPTGPVADTTKKSSVGTTILPGY
jgi:hypothetical protein